MVFFVKNLAPLVPPWTSSIHVQPAPDQARLNSISELWSRCRLLASASAVEHKHRRNVPLNGGLGSRVAHILGRHAIRVGGSVGGADAGMPWLLCFRHSRLSPSN